MGKIACLFTHKPINILIFCSSLEVWYPIIFAKVNDVILTIIHDDKHPREGYIHCYNYLT